MQVNSVNSQNFGYLNTKKCSNFANELMNNDVLKKASKHYNITASDTHYITPDKNYVYDIVLNIQEKTKGLFNKLLKKGNKGSVTIKCSDGIRTGNITKTINDISMSDIEKSVAKQENIIKNVDKSPVDKILKDGDLDFRYKAKFGDLPQASMSEGVKKYYHADKFSAEDLSVEDLKEAMKSEIELKYFANMGII